MFVFTHFEQMIKKGVVTTILNKRVDIFFRCCLVKHLYMM